MVVFLSITSTPGGGFCDGVSVSEAILTWGILRAAAALATSQPFPGLRCKSVTTAKKLGVRTSSASLSLKFSELSQHVILRPRQRKFPAKIDHLQHAGSAVIYLFDS